MRRLLAITVGAAFACTAAFAVASPAAPPVYKETMSSPPNLGVPSLVNVDARTKSLDLLAITVKIEAKDAGAAPPMGLSKFVAPAGVWDMKAITGLSKFGKIKTATAPPRTTLAQNHYSMNHSVNIGGSSNLDVKIGGQYLIGAGSGDITGHKGIGTASAVADAKMTEDLGGNKF